MRTPGRSLRINARWSADEAPRQLTAILIISLLWGMNWPTLGLALREVPPWTTRALTLGGAGVFLLLLNLARRVSLRVPLRHWHRLLAFTLLHVVIQNILISYAQLQAPSGRIAIVTFTMPIWTTVLAAFVLEEPLNRSRKLSLAFGTLGLCALAWPAFRTGTYWGWVLGLTSAWCWAASVILIKRFPVSATPLAFVTWQLLVGGAFASVGALLVDDSPIGAALSTGAILALTYNVVSQSISQVLWYDTLGRLPAALASLGVLLVPTVAMGGSMLILNEQPTPLDCVGLILITCASATVQIPWLAAWHKNRKADGAEA
jgi:drug/metabolite transporter (DMT)-like permease